MTHASVPRILQVGVGAFGQNHLRAWQEIGIADQLWLCDADPARLAAAGRLLGVPADRQVSDAARALPHVDVVDIVTGSDTHFALCRAALDAGKDVFIEKPMTMTADEARTIRDVVAKQHRVLQVGYYYRFHPASVRLKSWIDAKELGDLRYLSGSFMGFKRARNDVGVTHTDGVHFVDLFNWLVGAAPQRVHAVIRDHFGRGKEDFSVVLLEYPNGVIGKVECGYIQPGRWRDRVVANAFTTKEIFVCGSTKTVEVDFEQELVSSHKVHHELRSGVWTAVVDGSETPNTGTLSPVQMIATELRAFLQSVQTRTTPDPNERTAGVEMAAVVEAIYESARRGQPVAVTGAA